MWIALEGGGGRSVFSAGVLQAIHDSGVPVHAIVGSSSGAINAAFFASGQLEQLRHLWLEAGLAHRLVSWVRFFSPWGRPGIDLDDLLDRFLPSQELLDPHAATHSDRHLYLCATDLATGRAHIARPEAANLSQWIKASMAIPLGYNRVVEIEGQRFVDGGVAMPVPFEEKVLDAYPGPGVAIITRSMQKTKPPPSWWQRWMIRSIVPKEARAITLRQHHLYNEVIVRLRAAVAAGEMAIVEPQPGMPVSRLTRDIEKLRVGFEQGLEEGKKLIQQLRDAGKVEL